MQSVWLARYRDAHRKMTAAEAVDVLLRATVPEGFEVIVPRKIDASEIHKIRRLPQVVGWRYWPGAHGRKPCGCDFCQRGQYGAKKLRREYESR
ncbi:MAG: hypothetical protein QM811_09210 [Pirellulales bacterium]